MPPELYVSDCFECRQAICMTQAGAVLGYVARRRNCRCMSVGNADDPRAIANLAADSSATTSTSGGTRIKERNDGRIANRAKGLEYGQLCAAGNYRTGI